MDLQMALVTRVIDAGNLRALRDYNLSPASLTNDEARLALEYVEIHHQSTGSVPSRELLSRMMPGIAFEESQDNVEILCFHVAEEVAAAAYRELSLKANQLIDQEGPMAAAATMAGEYLKLSSRYGRSPIYVVGSRPDAEFQFIVHDDRSGLRRVPFVWGPIQQATGGHYEGEPVILYARTKRGKSWALLEDGLFLFNGGYKVLLYSAEMRAQKLLRRLYAMYCRMPYGPVVTRKHFHEGDSINYIEHQAQIGRAASFFNKNPRFIIYDWAAHENTKVDVLDALVDKHQPDVLLIDQLGYLEPVGRHRERRHVLGANCRWIAKLPVPTMATHQSNRTGVDMTEEDDDPTDLSESDQIAQVAEYVIRQRFDRQTKIRLFETVSAREIENVNWAARGNFCHDMGVLPYDHPDVEEAKANLSKKKDKKERGKGDGQGRKPMRPSNAAGRPVVPPPEDTPDHSNGHDRAERAQPVLPRGTLS